MRWGKAMITELANRFCEVNPKKARQLQKEGVFIDVVTSTVRDLRKAYRDANPQIGAHDMNGLRMLDEMIFEDALGLLSQEDEE